MVVGVGDSITAGIPGWAPDPAIRARLSAPDPKSQWEYWAEQELGDGYDVRNCGVGGERTDEIAARLEGCVADADVAVLQGGVNDLVQRRSPASAVRNIRAMISTARSAGLDVLVANVLPVNRRFPAIKRKITRLNAMVRTLARDEGVELVDFFDVLEDPTGSERMRTEWAAADGVHPSVEGYRRLGRAVVGGVR